MTAPKVFLSLIRKSPSEWYGRLPSDKEEATFRESARLQSFRSAGEFFAPAVEGALVAHLGGAQAQMHDVGELLEFQSGDETQVEHCPMDGVHLRQPATQRRMRISRSMGLTCSSQRSSPPLSSTLGLFSSDASS